jgi:neurofibromin 1
LYFNYSIFRHSLLDAKINNVLSLCHDQAILNAVQSIIQNMIACEDVSQQQLSYLQSKFILNKY